MKVTEGVRKIIVEWHGKGVPPEETAQSLRVPIDEVKAVILQAHPAPRHQNAPNSSNHGTRRRNPPASATIDGKVKKSLKSSRPRPIRHAGNGGEANKKPPPCGRGIALSKRQV